MLLSVVTPTLSFFMNSFAYNFGISRHVPSMHCLIADLVHSLVYTFGRKISKDLYFAHANARCGIIMQICAYGNVVTLNNYAIKHLWG